MNPKNIPSSKKEKPIPLKPKSNNIESYINNELKTLKEMKKKKIQPTVKQNQPVIRDQESEKTKNVLKESMSKGNLNKNTKNNIIDDMNSSTSKFQGFNNTNSKLNETTSSNNSKNKEIKVNQSFNKNKKQEPFSIKFPTDQIKNEQTKEILDNLNKEKKVKNPEMKIKGEINSNKKNLDSNFNLPKGKMYNEQLNKIETEFYDDYDEYNDFIKDDKEIKKINKKPTEDFDDMFGENAEFNNVDDEYLKPNIKQKYNNKRDEVYDRINELKGAINLNSENIIFYEFDYSNLDFSSPLIQKNNKNEDVSTNTEIIEMIDNSTSTEKDNSIIMNNKLKNENKENENKENNNNNNNNINNINNNNISNKKISVSNIRNYQPLTYDAFKFFLHIGPYIENILLNNINKYILQRKGKPSEQTGMTKLDKNFEFPKDLLNYIFPSNTEQIKITFKKFLFFNTKPYHIAISISLTSEFSSIISNIFPDLGSNSTNCNLIILYSCFNGNIEKIFYSFGQINDLIVIGESENILISAKADGQFDIFDLNGNNDIYFMGYEKKEQISLARANFDYLNDIIEPKFKLILPIANSNISFGFNSQIRKLIKIISYKGVSNINNINTDKLYDILCIDQLGFLGSFQIRESQTHYNNQLENQINNPYIKYDLNILIKRLFNSSQHKETEIIDMKHYNENIIYLLSNFGLCKLIIEGKDTFTLDPIYINNNEINNNSMTCFDISDNGLIVAGFNDQSIKIFNDINKDIIYSSIIGDLKFGALINKIIWSNVICKNNIGKLIRKSLIANFYVFTTKNDFIIYDLNQKKIEEIRKVKKRKEMGNKLNLTAKNSIIEISDSLFTDYSNYILQSDSSHSNEGKIDIHKLSLRKQYYEENNIERVNDKILLKILSLTNN